MAVLIWKISLTYSPGFIAGVTNPLFQVHDEWWDILCDIETGRITISNELIKSNANEGQSVEQYSDFDNAFLEDVS
jgi:hypothetical protein